MSIEDNTPLSVPNRLENFPIMMFSITMGLSGLAIAYEKASELFGVPHIIGLSLAYLDMIIFLSIFFTYSIKMILHLAKVKEEFTHPVRSNFFAAISISFLLVAVAFHGINSQISQSFFYIGTVLQTYFTFYTISFWINNNLELHHSNPAWFIPIVGNVLVPVAGIGYLHKSLLMYYFSVGLFFWIILTSILINRIIFHHQLASKFMPTLFIFIAPPAIASIAYTKMYGHFDMFSSFLYSLALFFTFLLIFMFKNFLKLKFFISWWAFTFPLTAVTIASMLAYKKTGIIVYSYFSYLFLAIATIIVLIVALKTIQHMFKKEICVIE